MTTKQKQCLLAYLGYYVWNVDGCWGPLSETACVAFQRDFGLTADGVCGTDTEKALRHAVAYGMPTQEAEDEPESGDFWDEIEFFTREEFRCHCGGKYCDGFPVEPEKKLLQVADRLRRYFNAPVSVSSGVRCEQHNANVGGVSNSRHKLGKAMDFYVRGRSGAEVLAYVQKQPEIRYAYIINDGPYVHMDVE